MKSTLATALVVLAGFGANTLAAGRGEPTPQEILRRCTHRAGHVTARTARTIHRVTHRAVLAINQLKADGQDDQAATVAENATQRTGEIADHGLGALEELAANCTEALQAIDAPEEALQLLQERMMHFAGVIMMARERSAEAIADALAG